MVAAGEPKGLRLCHAVEEEMVAAERKRLTFKEQFTKAKDDYFNCYTKT